MFFKKSSSSFTLAVSGMKCEMCAARVRKTIESFRGASANIDLAAGIASVSAPDNIIPAAVAEAVTNAGFPAEVK